MLLLLQRKLDAVTYKQYRPELPEDADNII